MNTLVSQSAAYLAAAAVLGLALGWWLGRKSGTKRSAKAAETSDRRFEALEAEFEAASLEVGRLADQLAQSKIEVEEAREKAQRAASELELTRQRFETESRQVASFEAGLAEKDETLEGLRAEQGTLRDRVEELERLERQAQGQIAALTRRLASAQARASEFEADARRAERQLESLGADVGAGNEADGDIESLREQLRERDETIASLEDSLADHSQLAEEVEVLRDELRADADRVDDLERRLAAAENQREKAERELEALLSTPLIDVDRMATVRPVRFDPADEGPSPSAGKPELLEEPRGAGDDLLRIRGIDEASVEILRDLGVHHFRQIAGWSESDIQWVAAHIEAPPDQILRERWREQAARLASSGSEPET